MVINYDAVAPPSRESSVDLLRSLCVVSVVLLHAIMVGVAVTDAGPLFYNASEGSWWIVPVSWALQVMPLFFIIGGFAGFRSYHGVVNGGSSAASFVASRVYRLLRPTTLVVGVVGALLAALSLFGVSADMVKMAGFRFGQPLWFLGVFLFCQALLPVFAAAHRRSPIATFTALIASVVVVDIVRIAIDEPAVGFVNLAFVWLALQQLGFYVADGSVLRLRRRTTAAVGAASLLLLAMTFVTGFYSPDLVANINPPTGALLLVGIVHTSVVSLLHDRIQRFSGRRGPSAFSTFVNRRAMTIYLWHMPVLLMMAGLTAVTAIATRNPPSEPGTLSWWIERPAWLATAVAATAVVAVLLGRFENWAVLTVTTSCRRVILAVVVGVLGIAMLLMLGTSPFTAGIAVVMFLVALRLARQSEQPKRHEGIAALAARRSGK